MRKGFYDPYSNYGRLETDGLSEWRPSFLQLASSLQGCSKRYERFCQKYRHHSKGATKCHWGSRMLKRLVETSGSKKNGYHQGKCKYPLHLILSSIKFLWSGIK